MNAQRQERTPRLSPADPRWWFAGRWPVGIRHPAVLLVRELIPGWADTPVMCPHCPLEARVVTVLDHLLGEHGSELQAAAEWLETVDGDLFALAVHYLMGEARTAETSRCS
jgi:hypothetical protein